MLLRVGGVVAGAAGVRVGVGERQRPVVVSRELGEGVNCGAVAGVEGEVVETGPLPVVLGCCQCW